MSFELPHEILLFVKLVGQRAFSRITIYTCRIQHLYSINYYSTTAQSHIHTATMSKGSVLFILSSADKTLDGKVGYRSNNVRFRLILSPLDGTSPRPLILTTPSRMTSRS